MSTEARTNRLAIGIAITVPIIVAVVAVIAILVWLVVLPAVSEPQIPVEDAPFVNLPFPDQDRNPEDIIQIIGQQRYDELINSNILRRAESEYWMGGPCIEIWTNNVNTGSGSYTVSWVSAIVDGNIVGVDTADKKVTIKSGEDEYSFYITKETHISMATEIYPSKNVADYKPEDIIVEIKDISFEELKAGDALNFAKLRINPDRSYALSIQTVICVFK
jgi:hypothetical protein